MGDASCLADGVNCYSVDKVVLGRNTIVSQYSFLCTASHAFRERGFPLVTAPIVIEDDAWVAADVFIGPGVTIGARAVAGARAVVTCDIEPGTIVAGNPARVIGKRDEKQMGECGTEQTR
jgi:putative colanic acid biosynthesis acetyltransferase WcaF